MAHLNDDPRAGIDARDARDARAFLFTGPFRESWTRNSLDVLTRFTAGARRPVVLLPTDIQMEDYAPRYRVRFGPDARGALERLLRNDDPSGPNLVLIDFAPELTPDHDVLLPTLNAGLQAGWPDHLTLVVLSPSPAGLHLAGFDERHPLP